MPEEGAPDQRPDESLLKSFPRDPDQTKSELDDIEGAFEDRLMKLESKAKRVHGQYEQKKEEQKRQLETDAEASRGLGVGMSVAYTIIGTPLLGFGIGWLIDRSVGGKQWQSWCTLIGSVLGVVFAIVLLNRYNREP